MSASAEGVENQDKSVKNKQTSDKNLSWPKCSQKIFYHQTTKKLTKIKEVKTVLSYKCKPAETKYRYFGSTIENLCCMFWS